MGSHHPLLTLMLMSVTVMLAVHIKMKSNKVVRAEPGNLNCLLNKIFNCEQQGSVLRWHMQVERQLRVCVHISLYAHVSMPSVNIDFAGNRLSMP